MPNPKQGQKKKDGTIATPRPTCPFHQEEKGTVIMERLWKNGYNAKGTRVKVAWGWGCPEKGCTYVIKD